MAGQERHLGREILIWGERWQITGFDGGQKVYYVRRDADKYAGWVNQRWVEDHFADRDDPNGLEDQRWVEAVAGRL